MLTGLPSRLVGVDIDDEGGEEWVSEMWHGETWEYTTGKGRRLLFRHNEPFRRVRLTDAGGRSFEVLGDATNNVLPPSEHASGRVYAWTPGHTPRDIPEPADLPEWAMAAPAHIEGEINSDEIDWVGVIENDIVSGQRNDTMTSIVGRLVCGVPLKKSEAYLVALLINGAYGKPPLPDFEIRNIVKSIDRKEAMSRMAEKKEVARILNDPNNTVPAHLANAIVRSG